MKTYNQVELTIKPTPDGRYETHDGKFLSSPSRILKPLANDKYKDIAPWMLEIAATFGKKIHEAIEFYIETGDAEEIKDNLFSDKEKQTFNQFLEFAKEINLDINKTQTECLVWNEPNRYFGYIDLIAEINGRKTIIDIKTRSTLESDDDFLVETLQLMLYKEAIYSMTDEELDIALLVINKNTKSKRLFKVIDKNTQEKFQRLLNGLKTTNNELLKLKDKEKYE